MCLNTLKNKFQVFEYLKKILIKEYFYISCESNNLKLKLNRYTSLNTFKIYLQMSLQISPSPPLKRNENF